jgi:hypothetical protein
MSDDESTERSVSDHVEEVARAAATMGARGAELAALQHRGEVRRATRAGAGLVALVVAGGTVFVFANWALERALESSLSGWRAPLVLAAAWLVVAVIATVVVMRAEPRLMRRRSAGPEDPAAALAAREAAFAEAQGALLQAVEGLAGAITAQAAREVAAAALPDDIADAGEKVVEATDVAVEYVDDVTDVIEERVPGGVLVNRAFDLALFPGRYSVRAARIVLRQGQPSDREPDRK